MANSGQHCNHCGHVMSDKNMVKVKVDRTYRYYHKKCHLNVQNGSGRSDTIRVGNDAFRISGLWPIITGEKY